MSAHMPPTYHQEKLEGGYVREWIEADPEDIERMKTMTPDELMAFLSQDILIEVKKHPIIGINDPWKTEAQSWALGLPVVARK